MKIKVSLITVVVLASLLVWSTGVVEESWSSASASEGIEPRTTDSWPQKASMHTAWHNLAVAVGFTPASTFVEVAAAAGVQGTGRSHGVAFGDYDGDGDLDMYVTSFNATDILFRNNGTGTFSDATASAGLSGLQHGRTPIWGDYDNDGDLDLYVTREGGLPADLWRNNSGTTFTNVATTVGVDMTGGMSAAWGDYDRDGFLDILVTRWCGRPLLYRNNGDGTFTNRSTEAGLARSGCGVGAIFGDYDSDGDPDIYLTFLGVDNALYRNNGDGTFTDVTTYANVRGNGAGEGAALGDYDNDGDLDLYVVNDSGHPNILYRNNGDGTFTDVTNQAGVGDMGTGRGVALGDYDNDGYLDITVLNWDGHILYHNNSNGTFSDVTELSGIIGSVSGNGVAFGDYDDDGDLDIYATSMGVSNFLYRNNGNANHWLVVRTIGTVSNRTGIGARVKVTYDSLSQVREVSGGSGFHCQDSLPVEFGLGMHTQADTIEIRWPSGIVQTLTNMPANQILTVVEQTGPVCGGSVDVVFAMDTSGSMDDEFSALCSRISDVVTGLRNRGLTVKYRILGIDATRNCATQTVSGLIPGGTVNHIEDWGPAVVDLSNHYTWEPGYTRLIIPMSDEGPENGNLCEDPGPDRDAISQACAAAQANNVLVSPVQGTAEGSVGDAACVEQLMRDLAACTGGLYFRSTDPASDLADALADLIGTASCTPVIASISPDCDIIASTVVTINGQNFQPDATVELRLVGGGSWIPAVNVIVVSDTQITFQVPASLARGEYEVRVTNLGVYHSSTVTIWVGAGTCNGCPEIPNTPYFTHYYRNVTIEGAPAPVGTIVTALNPRGDVVGCFEVTTPGLYGYMRVYGEDAAASPSIPGMRTGEPVTFEVNGVCADTDPAPVLWQDDKGYHAVDLTSPCVQEQRIPLHSGWNWFSINRTPSDSSVPAVLTSISGKYDLVLGEDGVYAPPPADPAFNTLTDILPGEGYMIRMTHAAEEPNPLLVSGPLVPANTPIPLHSGWNWLGYLPESAQDISHALNSIAGKFDLVLGETGTYAPPPANPAFNTLSHLEPGRGYLIRMTQAATLVYPATAAAGQVAPAMQPAQICDVSITPYFTHYYDDITIGGLSAPAGAVVEALSPRGDVVGCFEVTTPGLYGYMRVYGEDAAASPPIPGMRVGEEVTFRVNGMPAVPAPSPVIWQDDKGTHEVLLSVSGYTDFLPLIVR